MPNTNTNSSVISSVEYIRWTDSSDMDIVYVGVMTKECDDTITFLTKSGEMTIPKMDGHFELASREDFDNSVGPVVKEEKTVVVEGNSKMAQATRIFQEMSVDPTVRRIDIINAFVAQLGIKQAHASTYHQTIKVKLTK
jgi:hypothetical protein